MRKRIPPQAAENSPRVAADKGARGSSGLWALLMAWVAYLVCIAAVVYRAGRLPCAVRSSRQQRTENWKSTHLEHQAARGNGQKQVHTEEEYLAGHVSELHSVSKPEQDISSAAYWICAAQTGATSSVVNDDSIYFHYYGSGTALAACPSAGGLRQ